MAWILNQPVLRGLQALLALAMAGCSPTPEPASDPFGKTGELIALSGANAGAANACVTCHGLNGEGDGAGVPRLAGLPSGYLASQLEAYADGRRQHPSMAWISGRLTQAQRIAVADHYAALPVPSTGSASLTGAPAFYTRGDPSRSLPACTACHGAQGQGIGAANPPLDGQPAAYLAAQLRAWRKSERRNDPDNVMLRISRQLTDREIAALEAFWAGAGGEARRESPEASR